jgi:hypothetical protein
MSESYVQADALEEMLRSVLRKKERRWGKWDLATMRATASLAECLCKRGKHAAAMLMASQLHATIVQQQTMLENAFVTDDEQQEVWLWGPEATPFDAVLIPNAHMAAIHRDALLALASRLSAIDSKINIAREYNARLVQAVAREFLARREVHTAFNADEYATLCFNSDALF